MKITPDHLARGAFITFDSPPWTSSPTIMRADGVNMALPTVLVLSVGRM